MGQSITGISYLSGTLQASPEGTIWAIPYKMDLLSGSCDLCRTLFDPPTPSRLAGDYCILYHDTVLWYYYMLKWLIWYCDTVCNSAISHIRSVCSSWTYNMIIDFSILHFKLLHDPDLHLLTTTIFALSSKTRKQVWVWLSIWKYKLCVPRAQRLCLSCKTTAIMHIMHSSSDHGQNGPCDTGY